MDCFHFNPVYSILAQSEWISYNNVTVKHAACVWEEVCFYISIQSAGRSWPLDIFNADADSLGQPKNKF